MSHLHFVSTYKYFKELYSWAKKENIFNVGSLGVENIKKMNFFKFRKK